MKKADQYNIENGSPSFGPSKFADRTDDGYFELFSILSFILILNFWYHVEFAVNLGRKNKGKAAKEGLGEYEVRKPTTGGDKYGMKKELSAPFSGTLPSSVDWTAAGYVTAVKNQGSLENFQICLVQV